MLIKFSDLKDLRGKTKKKIVFVGGTFDLMHLGHVETFKNVKKYGDIVVVGVSTDKRVKERKGSLRPIQNQSTRAQLVDAIKGVDYVFIYPSKSKEFEVPTLRVLNELRPDVFVTVDNRWEKYRNRIEVSGKTRFVIEPYRIKTDSTTQIIRRILKRHKA